MFTYEEKKLIHVVFSTLTWKRKELKLHEISNVILEKIEAEQKEGEKCAKS